jgi:two-component system sensor histidine kinase QseC
VKSIRAFLLVRLLAGLATILIASGAAWALHLRVLLRRDFDTALLAKARALASLTEASEKGVEMDFSGEVMPEFQRPKKAEYFQLWLASGRPLVRSPSLRDSDLQRPDGAIPLPYFWDLRLPDGRAGRAVAMNVTPQPAEEDQVRIRPPAPPCSLVVARERETLNRSVAQVEIGFAAMGLLVLVGVAGWVLIAVSAGLRPLRDVAEYSQKIDAGNLRSRFPSGGVPAELQPLIARLNELLDRLEKSFQRERQMTADLAHEFRTPVAELRILADLALQFPDEHASNSFLEICAISKRMESIVAGMLSLSRHESEAAELEMRDVALAPFVTELWQPWAKLSAEKQIHVSVAIPGAMTIRSDTALLRLVLQNLFRNAAEYTPASGAISMCAASRGAGFEFSIENTNENLMPEDIPHLFERFWRKDPSRTSDTHHGIGLALAHTVATVLGLRLTARLVNRNVIFELVSP